MSVSVFFLLVASCSSRPVEHQKINIDTINKQQVLAGTLKVVSLNMAHGRKDANSQLSLDKQTIRRNLSEIATALKQTAANIIALQEADGPSRWSGNFDHVAALAQQANYPWYCRASHARGWLFDYGTALLSQGYFVETLEHSFQPTPPTLTKGFLLGQVAWQPREASAIIILIDIVSVHLDFSREKVRQQQIAEIAEVLADRNHPLIVLGDFNSEWLVDESVVAELAHRSGLHTYQPEATDLGTYKSGKKRLDWILISDELEFKSYQVLADVLSDHAAVVADIGIKASVDVHELAIDTDAIQLKQCGDD